MAKESKIVIGSYDDVEKYSQKTMLRNIIRCKHCDDLIESRHNYHAVKCSCGAIMVDGGLNYCRVLGELSDFEYRLEWLVSE